jgi:hypothetical protein
MYSNKIKWWGEQSFVLGLEAERAVACGELQDIFTVKSKIKTRDLPQPLDKAQLLPRIPLPPLREIRTI